MESLDSNLPRRNSLGPVPRRGSFFGRLFLALYLVSQSVTAKDHTLVQVNPDHRRAIGKGVTPACWMEMGQDHA